MLYNNIRQYGTGCSHTTKAIKEIGDQLWWCLVDRYSDLSQCLFEWDDPSGKCDNLFVQSGYQAPEALLLFDGSAVMFDYAGDTIMLPYTKDGPINIYGQQISWRPIPVGGTLIADKIRHLSLNFDNSVIVYNTLNPTHEFQVIRTLVTMYVDTILTIYQRLLLARSPFIITTEDMNDANAEEFVRAILSFTPAILRNSKGGLIKPEVMNLGTGLETSLLDASSFFESLILTYIGYDCTDVHKRAQMSIPEVLTSKPKIHARREEKLRCRTLACERYNKMFHNELTVKCIADKLEENDMNELADRAAAAGGGMRQFNEPAKI